MSIFKMSRNFQSIVLKYKMEVKKVEGKGRFFKLLAKRLNFYTDSCKSISTFLRIGVLFGKIHQPN